MCCLALTFSGYVAERVNLRYFLATGMICAGASVAMFGVGYFLNIHNFYFYLIMQVRAISCSLVLVKYRCCACKNFIKKINPICLFIIISLNACDIALSLLFSLLFLK